MLLNYVVALGSFIITGATVTAMCPSATTCMSVGAQPVRCALPV